MQWSLKRHSVQRIRGAKQARARVLTAILAPTIALTLSSCAQVPDPEETIDTLTSVTEAPEIDESSALDEYNVELFPTPIVEPLECTPYLVITARGTAEPKKKNQLLSPIVRELVKARPGQVTTLDLDYPADADVNLGGTQGVRMLLDTLRVQTETCAEQKFVLLGYSQGALVIGDALAEPATRLVGHQAGELSEEAADRVIAIVFYGDPRFSGAEPHNYGDYDEQRDGILPRADGALDRFSERLRDFCVARDFICQSSTHLDEEGHVSYYTNGMQQDGAAFIITRLDPLLREAETPLEGETSLETEASLDAEAPADL
ncbi:MAG: cutinase family protein [Leucobacter sp.]|nr:cutinase family protein [Leucobacter sp.]